MRLNGVCAAALRTRENQAVTRAAASCFGEYPRQVNSSVVRNHVSYRAPVVIDARLTSGFPDELFCDEATAATVSQRWREYFPRDVEMGDSDRGHLDGD